MNLVDLFVGNLVGFALGIVASFIFLRWQLAVKPKIEVSKAIYDSGQKAFRIKVANQGRRQVLDIQASFFIMKRLKSDGVYKQFFLKRIGEVSHPVLVPKKQSRKPWGLLWACTLRSTPDPEAYPLLSQTEGNEERRLVVRLHCSDAVTGTKLVEQYTFPLKEISRDKQFGSGLEITDIEKASSHQQPKEDIES